MKIMSLDDGIKANRHELTNMLISSALTITMSVWYVGCSRRIGIERIAGWRTFCLHTVSHNKGFSFSVYSKLLMFGFQTFLSADQY